MKVIAAGRETPLTGRKQRILLAHLTLNEGWPVSTRRLRADLWPDAEPKNPAHALQEHVSRLRTTTGLKIDLAEGAGYRIEAETFHSDARDFARVAADARASLDAREYGNAIELFEVALGMWRGPALDGLGAVDGLRSHVLQLQQERRLAASDRFEAYLQGGRAGEIIEELGAAAQEDPLHERTWYQLVSAHHLVGRRTDALLAFDQARENFIETLGVGPSPRLRELHAEILESLPPEEPVRGGFPGRPRGKEGDRATTALIGREVEMGLIEKAWRRVDKGLQLVTISGEPGIGKSFLAAEFARGAAATGTPVLTGRSLRISAGAYHPFTQILRECARLAGDGRFATKNFWHARSQTQDVPEGGGTPLDGHGLDLRAWEKKDSIAARFEEISAETPVVVVLEDLHWADPQSIRLIDHLLHSPRRIRMLCITTVRDSEMREIPDGPQLFRQSATVTHVPLAGMSGAEIEELIRRETAGKEFPPWAPDQIQEASGGNPLFAVEYARDTLLSEPGRKDDLGAPLGIRMVIEGHVNALPAGTANLLRAASIFAGPFDLSAVAGVMKKGLDEVGAAVGRACAAGLLKSRPGAGFAFGHEVVQKVMYESLSFSERTALHRRAAAYLEGNPLPVNQHETLAYHLQNSGCATAEREAADHLLQAGREALDAGAPESAEVLLAEARRLVPPSSDEARRCDVLTYLGIAQLHCGREEYRSTLLEATRIAIQLNDRDRLITAVLHNTRGWWSLTAGVDHERVAGLEAALAAREAGDQVALARLLVMWAQENVRDPGSREVALERSARALELAEQLGDPKTLALVLAGRYEVLYALFHRPAECVMLSQRLLNLALRHGFRLMSLSGAIGVAQSAMLFGEFHVADRYLDQALQLSKSLNHPPRGWLLEGWSAMREAMRGRLGVAERLAEQAHRRGVRSGQSDAPIWFAGQIFAIRFLQGRLEELLPDLKRNAEKFGAVIPAWNAALALGLATGGEPGAAERALEELAAEDFAGLPRDVLWLSAMCYLAVVCEEVGRVDLGMKTYEALAPYSGMVATNGTISAGPVDLYLGVLAGLAGNRSAARGHLQAAVTQCRRMDAPLWQDEAMQRLLDT